MLFWNVVGGNVWRGIYIESGITALGGDVGLKSMGSYTTARFGVHDINSLNLLIQVIICVR